MGPIRILQCLALLVVIVLGGCHERRQPLVNYGSREQVKQLGFVPLIDAQQHHMVWNRLTSSRLQAVDVAPDGKTVLLVFRRPFMWDAGRSQQATEAAGQTSSERRQSMLATYPQTHDFADADALWLDLGEKLETHGLYLGPGRSNVRGDFSTRTVTYAVPDPGGTPAYYSLKVDDGSRTAIRTPHSEIASSSLPAGWTPPAGRRALTYADASVSTAQWIWLEPQAARMTGTGRAETAAAPGELLLFENAAAEPTVRLNTGSLPFASLVGDAANRRAFMALDNAGVVMVDYSGNAPAEPRWLLRDSGSHLFLLPSVASLVVQGPETLSMITLNELAQLAPRLEASAQLGRDDTRRLKPALEGLGWDWKHVQLSPLAGRPGRLTFLDSSDLETTTAELVWSARTGRALKMTLTRRPRDLDDQLRARSADERERHIHDWLVLLGWPHAQRVDSTNEGSAPTAEEVREEWALVPDAEAPRDPGRFSLWLTPDAAVWELRAATDEFGRGTLSVEEARSRAMSHFGKLRADEELIRGEGIMLGDVRDRVAQAPADSLFAELYPQLGWISLPGGPDSFAQRADPVLEPEAFNNSVPYYMLDVALIDRFDPALIRVQLQGYGGNLYLRVPHTTPSQVRRRILAGEFGPEAIARLNSFMTAVDTTSTGHPDEASVAPEEPVNPAPMPPQQ